MQSRLTANRSSIPILTYHQIAVAPARGAGFRSLYVSPRAFDRQMACLQMLGYKGLSMSALLPYLRGEQTGKVVGITFDDGYLNNLTHAMPVLQRYGFTSTCYFVSGRLGQTNVWDRAAGVVQTSLMNPLELRQWLAAGQEVGAHTRTHARLPQLEIEQCKGEIADCKSELEALTGSPVRHFCYPYGDMTRVQVEMAQRVGFDSATTTRRGRCQLGDDLMQLPRVPVLRSNVLALFWLKVATGYEDRRGVR